MSPEHYVLSPYGKWGWRFTSPLGSHRLPFPRDIAESKLAEIRGRHATKADGSGPEAEIFRGWFDESQVK